MIKNALDLAEKLAADPNRKQLSAGFSYFIAWWEQRKERRRRTRARALQRYYREHGYYDQEGQL